MLRLVLEHEKQCGTLVSLRSISPSLSAVGCRASSHDGLDLGLMWAPPPPPPEFMGKVLFMVIGQDDDDAWEIANHATQHSSE